MSASDAAMLQGLVERVEKLEKTVHDLVEGRQGKELHGELYGEPVNHTEDREARRGPGKAAGAALMPSRSKKQAKTMAAAAHNPAFAKKVGIPPSVARDFNKSDKKTGILKGKKK